MLRKLYSMANRRSDSTLSFLLRVTPPPTDSMQEAATGTPPSDMSVTLSATHLGVQERMAQWCATLAKSQDPLDWDLLARKINKRSPDKPPISPEECRWVFSYAVFSAGRGFSNLVIARSSQRSCGNMAILTSNRTPLSLRLQIPPP